MRKILVGVMPQDKIRARAIAIAKGEFKTKPGEPKVWFTSMRSLAAVLSDSNSALLQVIKETAHNSIAEPAQPQGEIDQ